MKTVLSGIQPTGNIHLGNYLGSIKNWIDMQDQYRCLFGIMNLHAITLPQDPKTLRQNVIDAAIIYLACGLDPQKSDIFVQSEVSAHAEIAWVLGCITPMGWLNRMTQFKDKVQRGSGSYSVSGSRSGPRSASISGSRSTYEQVSDNANLGLYSYPVLMASDILTYHADFVPVGEDQKQHLELTRDLAGAFNRHVKSDYFNLPEPLIQAQAKRIMSLQDGTSKMSKSDESDLSRINITDTPEVIIKKVKKAKTDSESLITYDENRPEICNLLNIFASFSGQNPEDIAKTYENSGFGRFKGDLAEIIVEKLKPIQYNVSALKKDQAFVLKVLEQGRVKANEVASKTKQEVFALMGL